jgi:two-component system sensor histidine kinase MprB
MTFRRRTILIAASAVASAIVAASIVVYVVTSHELHGQIDASLREKLTPGQPLAVQLLTRVKSHAGKTVQGETSVGVVPGDTPRGQAAGSVSGGVSPAQATRQQRQAGTLAASGTVKTGPHEVVTWERRTLPPGAGAGAAIEGLSTAAGKAGPIKGGAIDRLVLPAPRIGGPTGFVQLTTPNGKVLRSGATSLPVSEAAKQVASGKRDAFFSNVTIDGARARMLTEPGPAGGVWQVALPLAETERTLHRLGMLLAIICLAGIALAALLGAIVSRAASAPLKRLTGAAERVARTQDLGHRIETGESDELGRLAASFNTMLAALERSRTAQRQLISDASHELRTPITSVRANLDALALGDALSPAERTRVIAAAQAQLGELTTLVGDLVSLSQTEVEEIELEDVRLDVAAGEAIARAQLHAPDRSFELDAEPSLVRVAPGRLARAIGNLLDNACEWSGPEEPIEVRTAGGLLEVRDHGPGIPQEDLPRIFDRFYRAAAARGRPGSGLGLAIVRQFAESHGGTVHAANEPDGGARLTIELPVLELHASELAGAGAPQALHEAPRSR